MSFDGLVVNAMERIVSSGCVLILVLAGLAVGELDEKKLTKRHSLVSRFTSNPFFLSHFSGYEPAHDVYPQAQVIVWQDEDASEEDLDGSPNYETTTSAVVDAQSEPVFITFEKSQKPIIESQQAELFVFGSLPHYDIRSSFRDSGHVVVEQTATHVFNALPLYEPNQKFHLEARKPILFLTGKDFREQEDFGFKILPHYDGLSDFNQKSNAHTRKVLKVVKKKKLPHTPSVGNLPLEHSRVGELFNSYDRLVTQN